METKKTVKANLEPKKRRFFFIGLTIALASTLAAFEWGVPLKHEAGGCGVIDDISFFDDDLPPITIPAPPEEIPIEKTVIKASIELTIVDEIIKNITDVKDSPEFPDFEGIDNLSFGGEEKPVEEYEPPVPIAEVMPSFQCSADSESAIFGFLSQNVRYPKRARDTGIEGTVYIEFTINKRGKMADLKVLRGVDGGCTEEALRVINAMEDWCPGKNSGTPVGVRFNVPIKFTLN
jgi:periplasmic protein TonB